MDIGSNSIEIPQNTPWTLYSWVYKWMPWVRSQLQIPNDDVNVIQRLTKIGVNRQIQHYFRHTSMLSHLENIPDEYFEDLDYFNSELLHQKFAKFQFKKNIIVFGSGPSLSSIRDNLTMIDKTQTTIVAADGATRFLIEHDINPDLIVSDFDGITDEIFENMLKRKIPIVGLTHGDNRKLVMNVFEKFGNDPYLHWATQGLPFNGWINGFGFTDGDRAVNLIANILYDWGQTRPKIPALLVGFDLKSDYIGKYSKPEFQSNKKMNGRKQTKLKIAWQVLTWTFSKYQFFTVDTKMSPGTQMSILNFLELH